MAILDERTEFCDAASVAAAAGTALIGDVIDLEAIGIDIGESANQLWLAITIDTAVITGGVAGTIQFKLASDAQAAIATDGTATVHWASKLFVTDDVGYDLTLGLRLKVPLPAGSPSYERYLGILATIATTTVTAGKINAFLTFDLGLIKHYADASQ